MNHTTTRRNSPAGMTIEEAQERLASEVRNAQQAKAGSVEHLAALREVGYWHAAVCRMLADSQRCAA